MTQQPIIDCQHLSFKYAIQSEPTLKDLSFQIFPGEKVLIAGASGSGKTTLLKLLNGLIPAVDDGDITGKLTIKGQPVQEQSLFDLSLHSGTVLQDANAQFVGLTVAEDIAFALENDAVPQTEMQQKVAHWAKQVDVANVYDSSPHVLSGGQKQRTAMAGVLIDDSELMLFDEPLASLDPAAGAETMALIDKLQQERDITVIIIEHRVEAVLRANVDRIIVMADGQIVANDHPSVILQQDVLTKCGLNEPLHLQLLRQLNIPYQTMAHLTHPDKDELLPYRDVIMAAAEQPARQPAITDAPVQLAVQELTFGYGERSLFDKLSFTINRGDILGIVGKNGSGKTTLMHLLTGFLTPDSGDIQLDGVSLSDQSIKERADHIGYVLQDPHHMLTKARVDDEVASGLRLRGYDEETITTKVADVLKLVDLYTMRNWPINALSYGQKKRLSVAALLVLEPEILILDEPTAGQDAVHTQEMLAFLTRINRQKQTTIIIITHDMHLLTHFVDRALVIVNGQLLADMAPNALLDQPDLVAAANLLPTSISEVADLLGIDDATTLNEIVTRPSCK